MLLLVVANLVIVIEVITYSNVVRKISYFW